MADSGAMTAFRDNKAIADKLGLWCRILDTHALERMPEIFVQDVDWDFGKDTVDRGLSILGRIIGPIELYYRRRNRDYRRRNRGGWGMMA